MYEALATLRHHTLPSSLSRASRWILVAEQKMLLPSHVHAAGTSGSHAGTGSSNASRSTGFEAALPAV